MKRYWIFAGDNCYPSGGMEDYKTSYDTVNECKVWYAGFTHGDYGQHWYHIYDSEDPGSKPFAL